MGGLLQGDAHESPRGRSMSEGTHRRPGGNLAKKLGASDKDQGSTDEEDYGGSLETGRETRVKALGRKSNGRRYAEDSLSVLRPDEYDPDSPHD